MKEKAILQVLALIRETEPPRPSTRLSQSKETIEGISKQRKIAAPRLGDLLRGELDWIVMRAMKKDRTRRYGDCFLTIVPAVRRIVATRALDGSIFQMRQLIGYNWLPSGLSLRGRQLIGYNSLPSGLSRRGRQLIGYNSLPSGLSRRGRQLIGYNKKRRPRSPLRACPGGSSDFVPLQHVESWLPPRQARRRAVFRWRL